MPGCDCSFTVKAQWSLLVLKGKESSSAQEFIQNIFSPVIPCKIVLWCSVRGDAMRRCERSRNSPIQGSHGRSWYKLLAEQCAQWVQQQRGGRVPCPQPPQRASEEELQLVWVENVLSWLELSHTQGAAVRRGHAPRWRGALSEDHNKS